MNMRDQTVLKCYICLFHAVNTDTHWWQRFSSDLWYVWLGMNREFISGQAVKFAESGPWHFATPLLILMLIVFQDHHPPPKRTHAHTHTHTHTHTHMISLLLFLLLLIGDTVVWQIQVLPNVGEGLQPVQMSWPIGRPLLIIINHHWLCSWFHWRNFYI
jgi:hypothetical protein